MSLIKRIMKHEGFRETPYPDVIHGWDVPTFGHGLTYITKEESQQIVANRIRKIEHDLAVKIAFFYLLPNEVQEVLIEMAYQMGVNGTMGFRNMLSELHDQSFEAAADEMLNSKWAVQTPSRARSLAEIVRSFK